MTYVWSRIGMLSLLALAMGCGAATTDDAHNDAAMQAAANLGVPQSPSKQLLDELSKGQPQPDLGDAKRNERNARVLPQVLTNSNTAMAKVLNGDDPVKAVADMQKQNEAFTK